MRTVAVGSFPWAVAEAMAGTRGESASSMHSSEDRIWVVRWKYEMAAEATRPGIWRLGDGGFFVRARVMDPRTGREVDKSRVLRDQGISVREALRVQDQVRVERRERAQGKTRSRMLWSEYAASLFEAKVADGPILSAASRRRWADTLARLVSRFGRYTVDDLGTGCRWAGGSRCRWPDRYGSFCPPRRFNGVLGSKNLGPILREVFRERGERAERDRPWRVQNALGATGAALAAQGQESVSFEFTDAPAHRTHREAGEAGEGVLTRPGLHVELQMGGDADEYDPRTLPERLEGARARSKLLQNKAEVVAKTKTISNGKGLRTWLV